MRLASPGVPPMRWRDYILEKGNELKGFWATHFAERERSVLFILGRGFDPRTHSGLDMILAAGGSGRTNVVGLDFDEGESSPSLAYASRVDENWRHIVGAIGDGGSVESRRIAFWSGPRRVGPINAANLFNSADELTSYDDVIVDISAMPRGIYLPLLARVLFLLVVHHAQSTG